MAGTDHRAGLIPALLQQWRAQRGLSQLDLALAADVSARHVSFLETGRSLPSAAMVLRLGTALGVPLRQVNVMLVAAGHEPVFAEPADGFPAPIGDALELFKAHHEPFPLVVLDHAYTVHDLNQGALAVMGAVLQLPPSALQDDAGAAGAGINLARLTFDPGGAQPYIANFPDVGRQLLWRIQREALASSDDELHELLDELLGMATVPPDWRDVDLSSPSEPALVLHLRRDELDLRFLTTVTAFQAPQNVAVEHLRIEHWFPFDESTATACRRLASPAGSTPLAPHP